MVTFALVAPRSIRDVLGPDSESNPALDKQRVSRGHVTTQSSRPVANQISPSPQRQLRLGLGGCHASARMCCFLTLNFVSKTLRSSRLAASSLCQTDLHLDSVATCHGGSGWPELYGTARAGHRHSESAGKLESNLYNFTKTSESSSSNSHRLSEGQRVIGKSEYLP